MISTILFGNGIGMALDKDYFQLRTGLTKAWESLTKNDKNIISLGRATMPEQEIELENHHVILTACNELRAHQNNTVSWLSNDGNAFPDVYLNFIYKSAKHFFEYSNGLPQTFIEQLITFIKNRVRCHIATLNYDKLIYETLINNSILAGYQDGGLVDGIHQMASGFVSENLLRTYYNFGWYLHLHGSPVFRTNMTNGRIDKSVLTSLPLDAVENNSRHDHIIIANTKRKPEIISNSPLLSTYFDFFAYALFESNELYIIGYSGLDDHVNFVIKRWVLEKLNQSNSNSKIEIIEWVGSRHDRDFWKEKLYPKNETRSVSLNIRPMDNILEYNFQ